MTAACLIFTWSVSCNVRSNTEEKVRQGGTESKRSKGVYESTKLSPRVQLLLGSRLLV
jgi:hypothetical protein